MFLSDNVLKLKKISEILTFEPPTTFSSAPFYLAIAQWVEVSFRVKIPEKMMTALFSFHAPIKAYFIPLRGMSPAFLILSNSKSKRLNC